MIAPVPNQHLRPCANAASTDVSPYMVIIGDDVLEWDSLSTVPPGAAEQDAVLLERRGITSQILPVSQTGTPVLRQKELWRKGTIHKLCVASKLHEQGLHEIASKLDHCHTEWTIAECGSCHKVRKFANRCDLFCCPECQHSLQVHRQRQVEWWTKTVRQPKHVVLTIHNLPDLTKGHLVKFKKYFSQLRRRKFCRSWAGGFYRIEITNEKRGWHLHLHALVDAKWIDKTQLSVNWKSITNGLGYIVDVKDCRRESYMREVTKYVVKGSMLAKWSGADIATFVRAFEGSRTFGVFGSLFGMRTKFAAFVESLRTARPDCECGASCMSYWTEHDWLARVRPSGVQHQPHAPPRPPDQTQFQILPIRWPD